jgi:hypothetical protein
VKLLIALLLSSMALAQPDAPSKLLSRPFIINHSIYLGSEVFDAEITHAGLAHHRCVELNINPPRPSRGDLYRYNLTEFGIVLGVDIGLKLIARHLDFPRWLAETDGSIGATVGTVIHVKGGASWLGRCW